MLRRCSLGTSTFGAVAVAVVAAVVAVVVVDYDLAMLCSSSSCCDEASTPVFDGCRPDIEHSRWLTAFPPSASSGSESR